MTIFEINFLTPLLFQDNELINGQDEYLDARFYDNGTLARIDLRYNGMYEGMYQWNGPSCFSINATFHVYVFYVNTRSIGTHESLISKS